MSLTPRRSRPSSEQARAEETTGRLPIARILLAVFFAALPWPAAFAGVYHFRSAIWAFVFYHGICLIGGLLLRSPGLPRTEASPFRRRHLLAIVLAANAVTLLLYLLVGAALLDRPRILALLEAQGLPPASYAWLFPYFALVNPLAEEFFWRGGVYATLRRLFAGITPPLLIAAALFGSWHWVVFRLFVAPPVALLATLGVMAVGVALTLVYERTRRLAYPIALHALAGDTPLLLLLTLLQHG